MMTRERELLQQALDALLTGYHQGTQDAIAALREALAAPEPEPVAWYLPSPDGDDSIFRDHRTVVACTGNKWEGFLPLYAAPPAAPEPEPVAEVYRARYGRRARNVGVDDVRKLNGVALPPLGTKLYAAPPAAPAPAAPVVPLTDEQINEMWRKIRAEDDSWMPLPHEVFARAIERAHGITGGKP